VSQIPTPQSPALLGLTLTPAQEQRAKRLRTDAIVESHRATTPQDVQDKRSAPRLSVAELNATDLDELRKRIAFNNLDNRPAFVKALDVLDLPRNALFNVVAPGIADKKRKEMEFGTGRLPVVRFSDILESAGVENRVARGVGGFVGDVLLDPLIFLGPAKGVKLLGQTGAGAAAAVGITASGKRALKKGVQAAADGGVSAVRDSRVRDLVVQSVGRGDAQRADELLMRLRRFQERPGAVRSPAQIVRERLTTRIDNGVGQLGRKNIVAASMGGVDEGMQRASQQFIQTYGKRGAGVLHVPFTTMEARIPGGLTRGQRLQSQLQKSILTARAGTVIGKTPFAEAARARVAESEALEAIARRQAALTDEERALASSAEPVAQSRRAEIASERAALDIEAREALEQASRAIDEIKNLPTMTPRSLDPGQVLAQAAEVARIGQRAHALRVKASMYAEEGHRWRELRSARTDLGKHLDEARARGDGPRLDESEAQWIDRKSREFVAQMDEDFADDLLRLTDEEIDIGGARVDSLHRAIATLDSAVQEGVGSLYKTMDSDMKAAATLAAASLGLDDLYTGVTVMMPLGRMLRAREDSRRLAALGETLMMMDSAKTQTFGSRTSLLGRAAREATIRAKEGAQIRQAQVEAEFMRDLQKLLDDVGIDQKAVNVQDDAFRYAMAVAHQRWFGLDADGLPQAWKFADDDLAVSRIVEGADGVFRPDPKATGRITELLRKGFAGVDQGHEAYPGLRARMEELVDRFPAIMYDLGQQEIAAGAFGLANLNRFYVPRIATPAGKQSVRQMDRLAGSGGDRVATGFLAKQGFEKPVTTRRYRVYLNSIEEAVGDWKRDPKMRVYEDGQGRLYQRFHGYDEANTSNEGVRELIERWNALPEPQRYSADISVFEFNRMVNDGEVARLRSPSMMGRDFFEENILRAMSARVGDHERYMAGQKLIQQAKVSALAIGRGDLIKPLEAGSDTVMLANGLTAKRVVVNDDVHLRVGGKYFRPLRLPDNNPLTHLIGDDATKLLYERGVAEIIENTAKNLTPENVAPVIRALDKVTTAWKMITLTHPSWTIVDSIGNLFNGLAGGARAGDYAKHAGQTAKLIVLMNRKPSRLKDLRITLGNGDVYKGDELAEFMVNNGLFGQNMWMKESLEHSVRGTMRSAQDIRRTSVPRGVSSIKQLEELSASPMVPLVETPRWRDYWNGWFRANSASNDNFKMLALLSHLEQGEDLMSAAAKVRRSHFDYGDMTKIESTIGRRAIPFYSWMRNNLAYQVRLMADRPIAFNMPGHIKEALETAIVGDQQVPEHERPRWMREAMMLQIGQGTGLSLANTIPQGDFLQYAQAMFGMEGAQDAMRQLVSSMNPVATGFAQIGVGREFFSGREIGPDSMSGDMSAVEFALGQIRPLREIYNPAGGAGATTKALREDPALGVGRLIMGGRVQDMSRERLERHQMWDFKREEQSLRRAISAAERDGRKEESLAARARLMLVYKAMLEAGLIDEVPVWARGQLSELNDRNAAP